MFPLKPILLKVETRVYTESYKNIVTFSQPLLSTLHLCSIDILMNIVYIIIY